MAKEKNTKKEKNVDKKEQVQEETIENINLEESIEVQEDNAIEEKDKKDVQIEELNDRLIRNMAEFDNFRKRSEKEKTQMFEIGAKSIVEKVLPVIDNFERGLGTVTEEEKDNAFVQGI